MKNLVIRVSIIKLIAFIMLAFIAANTVEASTVKVETNHDKRPKGYNYQKAKKQQTRQMFFYRQKNKNGGCGWHKATR